MPFLIKTQKGFVKRTSNFGAFHGSLVLTQDIAEAYRFTRKNDAQKRAYTAEYRTKQPDNEGKWYSGAGRDLAKFGETLITTIVEV
jgi:hypothetical protein